jgi:hypothetical protein
MEFNMWDPFQSGLRRRRAPYRCASRLHPACFGSTTPKQIRPRSFRSIRPTRASGTTAFSCRTGSKERVAPKNRHAGQVKCIALSTVSVDEQGSNPSTRRRLIYPFTTPVFVRWARTPFQQQLDDARLLLA